MANKRISELVAITAPELTVDDLLLLADVTAHESKKLRLADLNAFLLATSNSGSFYGTASWANYAVYALNAPIPPSVPYAVNAGYATSAGSATTATNATNATNAVSASYAKTGSWAITASYSLTSAALFADQAKTASYLLYQGFVNGTASFALTASMTRGTASYALTASTATGTASYSPTASFSFYAVYAANGGGGATDTVLYALSASWASGSRQALWATQSFTSSYLLYVGLPNGTASYALTAGTYPNNRINYGIYLAHSQSEFSSQIDKVSIPSSRRNPVSSSFEVWGTVVIPFTASIYTTCSIEFIALDRWSGVTSSLDKSPLNVSLPISGGTGSILVPFSLAGEVALSGSIMLYVTASEGAIINPNRIARFDITSFANGVTVSPAETMSLVVTPFTGPSNQFPYTSSGILTYGYDSDCWIVRDTVTEIDLGGINPSRVQYVWLMSALTKFKASDNPNLVDVGGMPPSLISMSVPTCDIRELAPLPPFLTSLECNNNPNLTFLPRIPSSVLRMDVSNCNIASIELENATARLVNAGLSNGWINISGNAFPYTVPTLNNIAVLQSRGWTCIT